MTKVGAQRSAQATAKLQFFGRVWYKGRRLFPPLLFFGQGPWMGVAAEIHRKLIDRTYLKSFSASGFFRCIEIFEGWQWSWHSEIERNNACDKTWQS